MERTLAVIKPDGVQRRLVGRIVRRFEDKGLRLAGMKLLQFDESLARRMYAVHEGKDFYEPLVRFILSGPVVAMVWEGAGAVGVVRALLGATFGREAAPGTIRGDFGMSRRHNLVHGSDSPQSAAREIALLFAPEELVEYEPADRGWVYAFQDGQTI